MPVQEVFQVGEDHMRKSVEHFHMELQKIRTGRATPALVEELKVEYYGTQVPLQQIATITAPDPHTLLIQPWDKTSLGAIEKAILESELGLNPANDGTVIRVPIPPLTEERRHEIVKLCRKLAEEARIAVRNIRRHMLDQLRKLEKEEHMSEDERRRAEQQVQKLTDRYIEKINEYLEKKEAEVMEV